MAFAYSSVLQVWHGGWIGVKCLAHTLLIVPTSFVGIKIQGAGGFVDGTIGKTKMLLESTLNPSNQVIPAKIFPTA